MQPTRTCQPETAHSSSLTRSLFLAMGSLSQAWWLCPQRPGLEALGEAIIGHCKGPLPGQLP